MFDDLFVQNQSLPRETANIRTMAVGKFEHSSGSLPMFSGVLFLDFLSSDVFDRVSALPT